MTMKLGQYYYYHQHNYHYILLFLILFILYLYYYFIFITTIIITWSAAPLQPSLSSPTPSTPPTPHKMARSDANWK